MLYHWFIIHFERIVKEAVIFFEDMGFEVSICKRKLQKWLPISITCKEQGIYAAAGVNRQFEHDHKFDMNIFTKNFRKLWADLGWNKGKYVKVRRSASMESFSADGVFAAKKKMCHHLVKSRIIWWQIQKWNDAYRMSILIPGTAFLYKIAGGRFQVLGRRWKDLFKYFWHI